MNIFGGIFHALGGVPDWVPCICIPAALLVYALAITLFGGRSSYPFVAITVGAATTALVAAKGTKAALLFASLYFVYAALLRLLLYIPSLKLARGEREIRAERAFKMRLCAGPAIATASPRVCRYEEEERLYSAEECGMRLSHAQELLARLRCFSLAAADRLETDVIFRTLKSCSIRRLTEEEMGILNDCLASIIKLSAKYKI
ncbi:MAG: hypothetical protein IKD43_02480 [Clostridia bacterium]|nr:hypothetical protein [Clostridia bacterium]